MIQKHDLLIIGAGPFGLAMAAEAQRLRIDFLIIGNPMSFWKNHMPQGMLLRSNCQWHLDTANEATLVNFLISQKLTPKEVEPLSKQLYLDYTQWFQQQKNILPLNAWVDTLNHHCDTEYPFQAIIETGESIQAKQVVLALGFLPFKYLPVDVIQYLPLGRYDHSCDLTDFQTLKDQRCCIIGGRQSAFESAALIHEAGAKEVHVCYRHPTPDFIKSDWSWLDPLMDKTEHQAGWYQASSATEKEALNKQFWSGGRLKLEPWLDQRIHQQGISLWPDFQLTACELADDQSLLLHFNQSTHLNVDHVLLATGYKVQMDQVPLLAQGNLLEQLESRHGSPVLDPYLQSTVPNLFITSIMASQDFGSFFAFTVSARASARLIGSQLSSKDP